MDNEEIKKTRIFIRCSQDLKDRWDELFYILKAEKKVKTQAELLQHILDFIERNKQSFLAFLERRRGFR